MEYASFLPHVHYELLVREEHSNLTISEDPTKHIVTPCQHPCFTSQFQKHLVESSKRKRRLKNAPKNMEFPSPLNLPKKITSSFTFHPMVGDFEIGPLHIASKKKSIPFFL